MRTAVWALVILAVTAVSVWADVTYTITVSDEQGAIVAAQTDKLNAVRRMTKNPPPDLTPADLARNVLLGTIEHWDTSQARETFEKDRADKRAKGKK